MGCRRHRIVLLFRFFLVFEDSAVCLPKRAAPETEAVDWVRARVNPILAYHRENSVGELPSTGFGTEAATCEIPKRVDVE